MLSPNGSSALGNQLHYKKLSSETHRSTYCENVGGYGVHYITQYSLYGDPQKEFHSASGPGRVMLLLKNYFAFIFMYTETFKGVS